MLTLFLCFSTLFLNLDDPIYQRLHIRAAIPKFCVLESRRFTTSTFQKKISIPVSIYICLKLSFIVSVKRLLSQVFVYMHADKLKVGYGNDFFKAFATCKIFLFCIESFLTVLLRVKTSCFFSCKQAWWESTDDVYYR